MKQLSLIAFLAFVLSCDSFARQIYDSEITCLDTDDVCLDDGHVFKDSDIEEDDSDREPLYPGYFAPEIEEGFEYS